jgi:protein-L-isoaspartate(D-aspartate) O-methyltransferase
MMNNANIDPRDRAERLRNDLTDYIKGWGTFRTPQVEAAFHTVPRHLFLPGVDPDIVYGRRSVVTGRAADGTSVSSASSPKLVATMLEQLGLQPGQRVLEIGAATGINAALLAEPVGPTGAVVTIELDDDLAA